MDVAKRWKATDKLLLNFQREHRQITNDLKAELLDFLNSVNITLADLNKRITRREREKLDKSIRENAKVIKKDVLTLYKVNTKKRYPSYSEYIELMLLILYLAYMDRTYKASKKYLLKVGEDAVKQAEEERGKPPVIPFFLTWDLIEKLLIVNTLQKPLWEYLTLLEQTFEEEAYKLFLLKLQSADRLKNREITDNDLLQLLLKQAHRIVYVHGDTESGIYVDIFRDIWHKVYIEPYKKENPQVRFIAEVDKVTTPMCLSMANTLFYTNDYNDFWRYTDDTKGLSHFRVFGLVQGVNLPPISNHFHWCRSTITYQIDNIFNTTL